MDVAQLMQATALPTARLTPFRYRDTNPPPIPATYDGLEPDAGDGADFGDALAQGFHGRNQTLILFVQQGLDDGRAVGLLQNRTGRQDRDLR